MGPMAKGSCGELFWQFPLWNRTSKPCQKLSPTRGLKQTPPKSKPPKRTWPELNPEVVLPFV